MTSVDLEWVSSKLGVNVFDEITGMEELVDAINAKLAEAREEQREACAYHADNKHAFFGHDEHERLSWANAIRDTALTSTPLADRIKELESHRDVRKHTRLMAEKMVLRETVREHEQENAKLKARVEELERALAVERECLAIAKSYTGEDLVNKCISLEMNVAVKTSEVVGLRAAVKKLRTFIARERYAPSSYTERKELLAETAHLEEE